ncbi:MAG TPA: DUF87 domain-containing protein [Candidatus Saccharibacteria bacterium]|nr:DUF87 domain-containing protein [Candidatus Saccharibacteria bacterium]HMR38512.1 DUF87 domain-containing protein [Candidatus Saccharibacteria bacterium]
MSSSKKYLGCTFWFEAYLQKSTLDGQMWDNTLEGLLQHIGLMRTLKIIVTIQDNMVRYYFGANKDLTEMSNVLDKISFRPIAPENITVPVATTQERLVAFVTGGNLLDLRERISANRGHKLEWSLFTLRQTAPNAVYCSVDLVFARANGEYSFSRKRFFNLPGRLIAVNFRENEKYGYQKFAHHLDIKKSLHIFRSDNHQALMEVQTYPYLPKNAYFDLTSYDFDKHSFIIGATGSGKSKFISLFIDRLLSSPYAHNYRVVVVDPHASLEHDIGGMHGASVINFRSRDDSTGLFAEENTDISASTELTATLFKSLLGSLYNSQVDRVVRYSLTCLMTAQTMSLGNLKRFLIDEAYRANILRHIEVYIPHNVGQYMTAEYPKLMHERYSEVVVPIVELIDEIELQAGGEPTDTSKSLATVVKANPLTIFSLNKVGMGEKVIKTVSGLLIQQLFLLAQARQFNEKIILIIDEVSVVQNPTIAQILAEARKYNMFVFLAQQYFGQVDKTLQDAIFSNVSNYFVFKVSEADARAIEGNITMELPRKMTMEASWVVRDTEDLKVPILTSLDPRDCVVRISSEGKVLPAFKAKTLDYQAQPAKPQEARDLTSYRKQHLPEKYRESTEMSGKVSLASKPQELQPVEPNLMEVLAHQSSRRNQRKGRR